MNLREAWSSSLMSQLGWTPDVEKAIDRIAAGGFCGPLGLALFHAKFHNDAEAFRKAQRGLERILARRYASEPVIVRSAMARQAMREYLWEFCPTCLGVGEINNRKLRVVCQTCSGTKVRRYNDVERAREMDITIGRVRSLSKKLQWLIDYVQKQDRQTNAMLVAQLRTDVA